MIVRLESDILFLTSESDGTCHAIGAFPEKSVYYYRQFGLSGELDEVHRSSLGHTIQIISTFMPQIWGFLPSRFEVPGIITQAIRNGIGLGGLIPGPKYNDRDYTKPFGNATWSHAPYYGSAELMPKDVQELASHRRDYHQSLLASSWFNKNEVTGTIGPGDLQCYEGLVPPQWVLDEYNLVLRIATIATKEI